MIPWLRIFSLLPGRPIELPNTNVTVIAIAFMCSGKHLLPETCFFLLALQAKQVRFTLWRQKEAQWKQRVTHVRQPTEVFRTQ
jgi:hypothetical protein